ncbi:MAG TPA: hypothetical protein DCY20_00405 [Firmicutes bacterium]|nr:hypothetical protein [Bacillota bacterium]
MVVNPSIIFNYSPLLVTIFPFCFGTLYAYYRYETISISNSVLFLLGIIIIQLLKSLLNKPDYSHVSHQYLKNQFYTFMLIMFLLVLFRLVYQTNLTVLILVGLTLLFHSFYWTAPSKRFTPLLVGIGSGIFLTILTVYLHLYAFEDFSFSLSQSPLDTYITLSNVLSLVTVSIPLMASTTNLYFSKLLKAQAFDSLTFENNILISFALFIIGYAAIILGMINQSLPMQCILMSLTIYPIIKNMIVFSKDPHGKTSLIRINFLLFNTAYSLCLVIAIFLRS